MRSVINLSLPQELVKQVRREVKTGSYASVSEFFRYLLRSYSLAVELKKERQKFAKGQGKILRSFKDLR